ncbi:MAG: hypothetical protein WC254_03690 [Candidatus Woesearchaeota archaeon]|jgi:hypothetical protein
MDTIIDEDPGNYNLRFIEGAHPLCLAALGAIVTGRFNYVGENSLRRGDPPPRFTSPFEAPAQVILFVFDESGKGAYVTKTINRKQNNFKLEIVDQ